jgi:CheY-like chemotaxis protein
MDANAKRILIIEDNRVMGDVMRFNLERAGFDTTMMVNGSEAVELLQNEMFDLIISDYQLPGMCGEEICRCIRQDSRFDDVPIFLCTAKRLELDEQRLMDELRISKVLAKPFSPREIVELVCSSLQGRTADA